MRGLAYTLATMRVLRAWLRLSPAYMDPGSGSMMLQVLLGGVAGLAVAARVFWDRLVGLLPGRKGKADSEASDEA